MFNPLKWFRNTTTGIFVEVFLDYGFGEISKATQIEKGPYKHTLYIPDLDIKDKGRLEGKRFNWGTINSHWRHYLELETRFIKKPWKEVQEQLV